MVIGGTLPCFAQLGALVERSAVEAVSTRLSGLRDLPMVGAFLTAERVQDLSQGLVKEVLGPGGDVEARLLGEIRRGLDLAKIVRERVLALPVEDLEQLVMGIARRELRAIERLGGVLGFGVGLAQALVHDPPVLILDEPTSGLDPGQVAALGLEKDLVPVLICKLNHFVFNRRAITGSDALNLAGIHRAILQVVPDFVMRLRVGPGNPAGELFHVEPFITPRI